MEQYLEESALILVAVVPNPRDLEIARLLGWYRIPFKSAPKIIAPDYLAFYQPASFGSSKWRIEVFAPVKGFELTTRRELLIDEPDHADADEEYYRVDLGECTRLPNPILSERWRRITFFYTTGRYFVSAHSIQDLVILRTDERRSLWHSLRERQTSLTGYSTPKEPRLLDDHTIEKLLGYLFLDPSMQISNEDESRVETKYSSVTNVTNKNNNDEKTSNEKDSSC